MAVGTKLLLYRNLQHLRQRNLRPEGNNSKEEYKGCPASAVIARALRSIALSVSSEIAGVGLPIILTAVCEIFNNLLRLTVESNEK